MGDSEKIEIQELADQAVHSGRLDLSSKCLDCVPSCVTSCVGLTYLSLSCNRLEALPLAMGELLSITELDLSYNKLQRLPASLGKLRCLTSLKASYNQLGMVGPEVSCLSSLESLHLNDNDLSRLPASLGQLTRLTNLHLQFNKLRHLPVQLSGLTSLRKLLLEGNPLTSPSLLHLASGRGSASPDLDIASFLQLLQLQDCVSSSPGSSRPPSSGASRGGSARAHSSAGALEGCGSLVAAVGAVGTGTGNAEVAGASSRAGRARAGGAGARAGEAGGAGARSSSAGARQGAADILVIDAGGWGGRRQSHGNDVYPDDVRDSWRNVAAAAARPSGGGGPTCDGDQGQPPLSTSDASVLEDVMGMPPAAAAVMYRTWDAVRMGVQEVQEGRPLTRGGTATGSGSVTRLLTGLGRPSSGTGGGARAVLTSSCGRPPTALARAQATGTGASASSVCSLLGSGKQVGERDPVHTKAAGDGRFEGLPPITFPLTAGVRAMLRQMSAIKPPEPQQEQLPGSETTQQQTGGGWPESSWRSEPGSAGPRPEGSHGVDPDVDIDLVRGLLGARNPGLLQSLEDALVGGEHDATEGDASVFEEGG